MSIKITSPSIFPIQLLRRTVTPLSAEILQDFSQDVTDVVLQATDEWSFLFKVHTNSPKDLALQLKLDWRFLPQVLDEPDPTQVYRERTSAYLARHVESERCFLVECEFPETMVKGKTGPATFTVSNLQAISDVGYLYNLIFDPNDWLLMGKKRGQLVFDSDNRCVLQFKLMPARCGSLPFPKFNMSTVEMSATITGSSTSIPKRMEDNSVVYMYKRSTITITSAESGVLYATRLS